MLLIIMMILTVAVMTFWDRIVSKYDLEPLGGCIIGVTAFLFLVTMIAYPCSLDTIAKMESFHDTNKFVYEKAVEKFPNSGRVITKNDSTNVITLSYDRIKLIAHYNENLTWYKRYQKNWFIGGFIGKVPKDLKYIMP